MKPAPFEGAPPGREHNHFDLLRLGLAVAVILSHSYQLVDGGVRTDPLHRLTGTLTLGQLAVDGFFLLSGHLILASWLRQPRLAAFLGKRILRIYPAYVVASAVCVFGVAPLVSPPGYFGRLEVGRWLQGVGILAWPDVPGVLAGTHYPILNGAMWTVRYEFRCYLLVALLGVCGALHHRWIRPTWLGLAVIAGILSTFPENLARAHLPGMRIWLGEPDQGVRLGACFLIGGGYFLLGDQVRYSPPGAVIALAGLAISLGLPAVAPLGAAVFGGYLLFFAGCSRARWLGRLRPRNDLSYGLYLYGWPIQKLLLWIWPALAPAALFVIATAAGGMAGWASWRGLEAPCLRLRQRISGQPAPASP